jgi:hypothetical protein
VTRDQGVDGPMRDTRRTIVIIYHHVNLLEMVAQLVLHWRLCSLPSFDILHPPQHTIANTHSSA